MTNTLVKLQAALDVSDALAPEYSDCQIVQCNIECNRVGNSECQLPSLALITN